MAGGLTDPFGKGGPPGIKSVCYKFTKLLQANLESFTHTAGVWLRSEGSTHDGPILSTCFLQWNCLTSSAPYSHMQTRDLRSLGIEGRALRAGDYFVRVPRLAAAVDEEFQVSALITS